MLSVFCWLLLNVIPFSPVCLSVHVRTISDVLARVFVSYCSLVSIRCPQNVAVEGQLCCKETLTSQPIRPLSRIFTKIQLAEPFFSADIRISRIFAETTKFG